MSNDARQQGSLENLEEWKIERKEIKRRKTLALKCFAERLDFLREKNKQKMLDAIDKYSDSRLNKNQLLDYWKVLEEEEMDTAEAQAFDQWYENLGI